MLWSKQSFLLLKRMHTCILTLEDQISAVPTVDTSGISFLIDLKKSTEKHGLEVVTYLVPLVEHQYLWSQKFIMICLQLTLVNPTGEVMEKLQRANKIHDFLGVNFLHLTIAEAVFSLSSQNKLQQQEVSSTLFIWNEYSLNSLIMDEAVMFV